VFIVNVIDEVITPNWAFYNADCIDVWKELPSNSIGYSIFSPPFGEKLYAYHPSARDIGNCRDKGQFTEHLTHLAIEQYRTTMPGRLLSFHCMNIPLMKERDGVIGLRDFRGDLIRMYEEVGFIFHSEVCIWKDPVMAMQRTKALGLLHKQLRKDSAMSRQGIPDYLVTMRKPGMNEKPIAGLLDYYSGDITNTQFHVLIANEYQLKKREDPKFNMPFEEFYSVNIWQRYASPVWMDIDPSDTLQRSTAREDKDERHICPLQLGVIRRGIQLWSMPGDIVASPFGGIGSEPYVAIEMGRKAIAAELKPIYWELGVRNCRIAEQLPKPLISDEDMEAAA
jgi:hypothetical protein